MKKSKFVSTPTKISDLHLDDYDDDEASFKAERLDIQKLRRFKQQLTV